MTTWGQQVSLFKTCFCISSILVSQHTFDFKNKKRFSHIKKPYGKALRPSRAQPSWESFQQCLALSGTLLGQASRCLGHSKYNQAQRCLGHIIIKLKAVRDTVQQSLALSVTQFSQAQRCPGHSLVKLSPVRDTVQSSA